MLPRSDPSLLSPGRRWLPLLGVLGVLLPTPAPAEAPESDALFMARLVARGFFRALVEQDVESMLPLCAEEVSLEGRAVKGREALKRELSLLARRARDRELRPRSIEVLTYQEAVRRFGPPPERLRAVLRPGQMVALCAFQRRGAVAVLSKKDQFFRIVALTD